MSFDELTPVEVADERRRGQLPRLIVSLLGVGLVLGVLFGVGSWFLGSYAQTEAGLCRVTIAPCSELSLASVESLSGVKLPPGTEVLSGYAQELGSLQEFRAVVVLPANSLVAMSSGYDELDALADVPAAASNLSETSFWTRPVRDPEGHDVAVLGTRADGLRVIVFDERQVPQDK